MMTLSGMLLWQRMLMGRRLWDADGGGGSGSGQAAGAGGGDPAKGAGGGPGAGDDVSGLKSALEKERQANKQLKTDLAARDAKLREAEIAMAQNAEGLKAIEGLKAQVAEFEFRDAKRDALAAAVKGLPEGKTINWEGAVKLLDRLAGTDPAALAAEVVESMAYDAPASGKGATGGQRQMGGQPPNGGGGNAGAKPNLTELWRQDPEAAKAAIAEKSKTAPFIMRRRET